MAARALAIVHTCMYDAWTAYDDRATGTQLAGALRRPASERGLTNKSLANEEEAISYAAYRALMDIMPVDADAVYAPLMKQLGYDPKNNSTDIETPPGIGNVACAAVLEFRHHDKANQLGDLAPGAYSDWTHFRPVNTPSTVPIRLPAIHPIDVSRWQPLTYVDSTGSLVTQMFMGAQWCFVTPFAMSSGDEFRGATQSLPPAIYGSAEYQEQAEELVTMSAQLNDQQKMMVEYWSDGPGDAPGNGQDYEQVFGRWNRFAQFVSARDHHSLDDDVKMLFALSNAMLDASIAAGDAMRAYDSVRPITAIPLLFRGKKIRAWGGPGKGTVEMDGSQWIPYQPATLPTPPFPEFVSGHSAFSGAAASILAAWTGSDRFGYSVTLAKGSSKIEPGITPAQSVVLQWKTFSDAANQAGISGLFAGVHFRRADFAGRTLGQLAAKKTWAKAQSYFDGTAAELPAWAESR
ncbi:MAG: vanadium-dependent haloperoxidase [Terriglobales bacterium]